MKFKIKSKIKKYNLEFIDSYKKKISSYNESQLFIIDKNGNLEFQFNNIASENKVYILNWSRIIKDKKIINSIKEKINKNIC